MDRQVVDMITENLRNELKINIIDTSLPYEIQKNKKDKYTVKWQN